MSLSLQSINLLVSIVFVLLIFVPVTLWHNDAGLFGSFFVLFVGFGSLLRFYIPWAIKRHARDEEAKR